MTRMSRFCGRCGFLWPLVLALLCTTACSRPVSVPTGISQAEQAPFDDREAKAAEGETGDAHLGDPSGAGLPFHDTQNLPAGTLLTVRLNRSITASDPVSEITFEGVIDEPVVIEGSILIPRGTAVDGRIESARISKVQHDRGFVRLALESLHIGGLEVPVHTASLFARQAPRSDAVIHLEKGRRLTFRLTQTVSVSTQKAELEH